MKNRTIKQVQIVGAAMLLATAWQASGQSADAIVNKLVQKGILTQQEADDLKKEADKDFNKTFLAHTGMPAWTKNVTFGGDFRLRMDEFWPESGLNSPERLRFRMRLRYGGVWTATDWATIGLRIGTGDERSSGGDGNPNSNNQTFTHFFSKKPLFVDAAYVTIKPPGQDYFSVTGGKMNKILWEPGLNSPMVYDPDLTPEGAVEQLSYKFGDNKQFQVFGNLGEFVLDELSSSTGDGYALDGQIGFSASLLGDPKAPSLKATGVVGYFQTMSLDHVPFSDASGNKGNDVNVANYLGNFDVAYARGEVSWKACSDPFLGTPAVLTASGEYDRNINSAYHTTALGNDTTAWTGQLMFGQAAKKGQWQIAYQYKFVEANSVLDSFTDDDFGGTDRKGHIIKAAYNVRDWWQIGVTTFITEKISNRPNSGHNQVGIQDQTSTKLFVDTMFKF